MPPTTQRIGPEAPPVNISAMAAELASIGSIIADCISPRPPPAADGTSGGGSRTTCPDGSSGAGRRGGRRTTTVPTGPPLARVGSRRRTLTRGFRAVPGCGSLLPGPSPDRPEKASSARGCALRRTGPGDGRRSAAAHRPGAARGRAARGAAARAARARGRGTGRRGRTARWLAAAAGPTARRSATPARCRRTGSATGRSCTSSRAGPSGRSSTTTTWSTRSPPAPGGGARRWARRHTRTAGLAVGAVAVLIGLVTAIVSGPEWGAVAKWSFGQAALLLVAGIVLSRGRRRLRRRGGRRPALPSRTRWWAVRWRAPASCR